VIITHIGGPTTLIEVDGWRLLTDPTFDPAGGHYDFGWGTSSDKLAGPAMALSDLPPIDAVLLTHDHHGDNLDAAGRALLAVCREGSDDGTGARRLRLPAADGLGTRSWHQLDWEHATRSGRSRICLPTGPKVS